MTKETMDQNRSQHAIHLTQQNDSQYKNEVNQTLFFVKTKKLNSSFTNCHRYFHDFDTVFFWPNQRLLLRVSHSNDNIWAVHRMWLVVV